MDLDGGGDYWFTVAATVRVQKVLGGLKWHKDILLRFWGQDHGLKADVTYRGLLFPKGWGENVSLLFQLLEAVIASPSYTTPPSFFRGHIYSSSVIRFKKSLTRAGDMTQWAKCLLRMT